MGPGKQRRDATPSLTDRSGKILFIGARKFGHMKDRVLRDFTQDFFLEA